MESLEKMKSMFTIKYRPSTISKTILLPRIQKYLTNDTDDIIIDSNILMVGKPGMGKTTVAKIIESKYDTLKINASKDLNMDALRNEVTDFCRTMDIMSDTPREKIVYLDEFDGVKLAVQDALRAFIEEYELYVRFVATCNDITPFTGPMLSRFTILNFEPENMDEQNYLISKYGGRLRSIAKNENIVIDDASILKIIEKKFPDFRAMTANLQYIKKTGISTSSISFIDDEVFNLILNPVSTENTYELILTKYSANVPKLLDSLGRSFSSWIFEKHPNKSTALAKSIPVLANYSSMFKDCIDPVILACALIFELQKIYGLKNI